MKKARACSICGGPYARGFRVEGLLLRYICDKCFLTRCVHCGTLCVDEHAHSYPGTEVGIYNALYCKACLSGKMEQTVAEELRSMFGTSSEAESSVRFYKQGKDGRWHKKTSDGFYTEVKSSKALERLRVLPVKSPNRIE